MRLVRYLLIVTTALLAGLMVRSQADAPTLADIIATNEDFTTLRRLVDAAPDIGALLGDPDAQLTFYAPTDFAFNGLFSDSMLTIEWYLRRPDQIDQLLRRHIAPVALDVIAQPVLSCGALGTMLPQHWLMLDKQNDNWSVNFRALDAPAEAAANGLLVPINSVLPRIRLYPAAGDHSPDGSGSEPVDPRWDAPTTLQSADGDVQTVLAADGRFGHWLALLDADATTRAHLNSAGVYTLFVPSDTVFEARLDEMAADLDGFSAANTAYVAGTVIPGYFTPDILTEDVRFNAPAFCSLDPEDVVHTSHDGDTTFVQDVALTGEVLYASNAVIYIVDGVRQPALRG